MIEILMSSIEGSSNVQQTINISGNNIIAPYQPDEVFDTNPGLNDNLEENNNVRETNLVEPYQPDEVFDSHPNLGEVRYLVYYLKLS
jgi:hypothetical protein